MKRSMMLLALLLCVWLLAGCQVAQLLEQVRSEEEGESIASESSAPTEASSRESQESRMTEPTSAQNEAAVSAEPALIGDFSLTEFIGVSYEDLVLMYGESEIYFWFEVGLYCQFEDVCTTFYFDLDMIDPYYGDATQWLLDPGEFIAGDGDSFYSFDTGRFRPSDFRVTSIAVWDTNMEWLLYELGMEPPVTLEMLNDCFGQIRTAEEDEMSGKIQTGRYSFGECSYWFTFDDDGHYVTTAHIGELWQEDALLDADVILALYRGIEADQGIIWLAEPNNYGQPVGDSTSYTMPTPLQRLLETEPPVEGDLYRACIDEGNTVLQLDLVHPPAEEELMYNLVLYEEIAGQIQQGMTLLIEMERVFIDGNLCYTAALGTDHPDHFVRERHFAVDVKEWNVYEYDVFTDSYALLGRG